jgi:two-component system sensor histidine kinase HydH
MAAHKRWKKILIIGLMTGGILFLHYFTFPDLKYHHAVYRMLFYLPLVLGCFWFGLKGAVYISAGVSASYLPYLIDNWHGLSVEDFEKVLEGVLYFTIAFILGFLVERERKKHRALLQAERLAAVGRAISEVAHEMKTPLIAIGGFTNQVCQRLEKGDPDRKKLNIAVQETARLEALVKNMLEFGRPLEIQAEKTSLNELVLASVEVAQGMAKKSGVELKADLDPSLCPIALDRSRVKQLLLNLMANGVQASPPGEQVLVRTYAMNASAVLDVTDHGCGIPEEHRKSIFHPFVSNKEGGTGLGLAISKKIVEAHGGEISFRSNGEKGVTFTVRFPPAERGQYKVI